MKIVTISPEELTRMIREAVRLEMAQTKTIEDDVMNLRSAAAFLHMNHQILMRYAREGNVPAKRLGREWRFRKSELLEWLDKQAKGA